MAEAGASVNETLVLSDRNNRSKTMSKFQRILALFSLFLLKALNHSFSSHQILFNVCIKISNGYSIARSIQSLNGGGSGYHSFAPTVEPVCDALTSLLPYIRYSAWYTCILRINPPFHSCTTVPRLKVPSARRMCTKHDCENGALSRHAPTVTTKATPCRRHRRTSFLTSLFVPPHSVHWGDEALCLQVNWRSPNAMEACPILLQSLAALWPRLPQ
jgi:hypothetical protein